MARRTRSNPPRHRPLRTRIELASFDQAGAFALRRFERRVRDAPDANNNALKKILKMQRHTVFGREHRFDTILKSKDITLAYRDSVPLSRYEDYTQAIDRIASGGRHVLTHHTVDIFAGSAGTGGAAKQLPSTRRARRQFMFFVPLVQHGVIKREFGPSRSGGAGISLMSWHRPETSERARKPVMSANNAAMGRMRRQIPLLWSSPEVVFGIAHQPTAWYLHALFGLMNRDANHIAAIFASHVVAFLSLIVKYQAQIIRDLESGRLSDHLQLSEPERQLIESLLPANAMRTAELRAAFETGYESIVPRLWPRMQYIAAITTGSFATYVPRLRLLTGPKPAIYTPCHAASEAIMGINLKPGSEDYVLAVGGAHYEFLPLTDPSRDEPAAVGIEDLQVGREYELVLTTFAGLYRYRIEDIVRIRGFHGTAPLYRFLCRKSAILNLVGEKTTEQHTSLALSACMREWLGSPNSLRDYSVAVRDREGLPNYAFYVELDAGVRANGENSRNVAVRLDNALCRSNTYYWSNGRKAEALGPVTINFVETGTFEALIRMRDGKSGQATSGQLKTPRITSRREHLQFLDAAVYLTTSGESSGV